MGFFDLFSNTERTKKGTAPAKKAESLSEYSGMRVEVLTPENELLVMAKLAIAPGGHMELQPLSKFNLERTQDDEPLPVKLRGFDMEQQKAVHMECMITQSTDSYMLITRLKITSKDNDRAFFRQGMEASGEIVQIGRVGASPVIRCEVVNISAGGACIRTNEAYDMGDKLMLKLNLNLTPDQETVPLPCLVCRVVERRKGQFEYGCRFINLNEATENQIVKAIMELQRKRIRR